MEFITEDAWEELFSMHNDIYTFDSFLQAVAKYPMFCGENNNPDYDGM